MHPWLALEVPLVVVPQKAADVDDLIGMAGEAATTELEYDEVLRVVDLQLPRRAVGALGDDVGDLHSGRRARRPVTTDAALCGDPVVAAAVLDDLMDSIVEQTIAPGDRLEHEPVVDADTAAEGAEPESTEAIFHDREHVVVGQTSVAVEGLELPSVEAAHSAAEGTEPQGSGAVA